MSMILSISQDAYRIFDKMVLSPGIHLYKV